MQVVSKTVLYLALAASVIGPAHGLATESEVIGRSEAAGTVNRTGIQSSNNSATISGTVASTSDARLPGATVILTQVESGISQQVISGDLGKFRATGLPPGNYRITANLQSFRSSSIQTVLVEPGDSLDVDLKLKPVFSIENKVTVIGSSPESSLEASEIRESSSHDLGEALSQRPGVWKIRKGGIANDVVMRGFSGRKLNVLIDGQRVYGACPNNMDPAVFHVDFSEVERVDFSQGPFDIRNQGGMGGSVRIVTRRPQEGWRTSGNLSLGSFGFVNPSAYTAYANDRMSILGGYSYRRALPYSDGSGRKFTELANYQPDAADREAFAAGTFWGRAGFAITPDQYLQVSYTGQRADDILYPYLKMDAVYDDTERVGVRWDAHNLGDTFRDVSLVGYYSQVSHWMTDAFRTSAAGSRGYSMGTFAATRAVGGRIETGLRDNWRVGFETYNRFWGATTEMAGMGYRPQYSIPDVGVSSFGAYAEYLKPLTDLLSVTGGIRVDRVEDKADPSRANTDLYQAYHGTTSLTAVDSFASGDLKLRFQSPTGIGVGIRAGTVVQTPEPTERYYALKRMGSDWVGNPDLRPSRNNGLEGSLSFERSGLFLQSNLFTYWVDNFVDVLNQPRLEMVPGVMSSAARSYANVDARFTGTELILAAPLNTRLFLSGDLSYVRGTKAPQPDLGLVSPNLAEIPPLRSRLALRYDDSRYFASIEGVFSAAQRATDLDLNESQTPSYTVCNLSVGVRKGIVNLKAGIGNLFNRTYAEHLSYQRDPFRSGVRVMEPGRNVFLNLGAQF